MNAWAPLKTPLPRKTRCLQARLSKRSSCAPAPRISGIVERMLEASSTPGVRPRLRRALASWHPRSAPGRVLLAGILGTVVGLLLPDGMGWPLRVVAGWDAGGARPCWRWSGSSSSPAIRSQRACRAAAADPGRTVVWVLVLGASALSVFAAAGLMRHAKQIAPRRRRAAAALVALGGRLRLGVSPTPRSRCGTRTSTIATTTRAKAG